jgi:hypothetical protein
MGRQAGHFYRGNQSRVGGPSERADSECRFVWRVRAKVKVAQIGVRRPTSHVIGLQKADL